MNKTILLYFIFGFSVFTSCGQSENQEMTAEEIWKLGWRIIASSIEGNYELASLQFDSLRRESQEIDRKYLVSGLEAKYEIGKFDEIIDILSTQDESMLQEICTKQFLSGFDQCKGLAKEKVENESLQMDLIRMYIDDQAARGNIMEEIITKFNIDTPTITQNGAILVDEENRNKLKQIISDYGFPTRKLVGKDAMHGVFLIIQHSDGDKAWQKSQLGNIEQAVKDVDMDGQSYAYLYDRIKVNSGEKQLYGTQFAKVDPIKKIAEIAETEDVEHLNQRRMEIGMMPIEMYKAFMLKDL